MKNHQIYYLEKLNRREIYRIQSFLKGKQPIAKKYFERQNPDRQAVEKSVNH